MGSVEVSEESYGESSEESSGESSDSVDSASLSPGDDGYCDT